MRNELKKQFNFNQMSLISLGILFLYHVVKYSVLIFDNNVGMLDFGFNMLDLVTVAFIYYFYLRSQEPFTDVTKSSFGTVKSLLTGFAMLVGAKVITGIVMNLVEVVDSDNQMALESQTTMPLFIFAFSVAIAGPIAEEVLYRGIIQHGIFKNSWLGVIVSTLIFSMMHFTFDGFDIVTATPYLTLGLALGLTYKLTNRFYVPVIMHILNNLLATIAIYYF